MTTVDSISDMPTSEVLEAHTTHAAYEKGCARGLDILAGALAVTSTLMIAHDFDARWIDSAIGYSGSLYLARHGRKLLQNTETIYQLRSET